MSILSVYLILLDSILILSGLVYLAIHDQYGRLSIYVSHESKHRLLLLLPLVHGFLLGQLSVMSSSLEG